MTPPRGWLAAKSNNESSQALFKCLLYSPVLNPLVFVLVPHVIPNHLVLRSSLPKPIQALTSLSLMCAHCSSMDCSYPLLDTIWCLLPVPMLCGCSEWPMSAFPPIHICFMGRWIGCVNKRLLITLQLRYGKINTSSSSAYFFQVNEINILFLGPAIKKYMC